jgi:ATP-binding cassette subfamily B protein
MPVALLYVGKFIDQVVALNTNSPAGNLQELWQLVALEFALALLTDGLNRMINLQIVYWAICFHYTSIRIMKHAATLDLDQFEDSFTIS